MNRRISFPAFALLLVVLSGIGSLVEAQEAFVPTNALRQDFWDTDGRVNAVVVTNGIVYVGGSFSYVAPNKGKVAAIDRYTGQLDSDFPPIRGSAISAIVEDGRGGWFIGGEFSDVGGARQTNLVHILSNNSIDPDFDPHPDAPVRALALDDNTLFLGGEFNTVAGQPRTRLAAVDLTNRTLLPWAPQANGGVSNILVAADTVFVCGFFTIMGGQPRNNLAALDHATGTATSWNPNANGVVRAMALLDDRLIVGGFFNSIGGQLRNGLASLYVNLGTANATPWDPNPIGGKVTSLGLICNTVYVGGYFTNIAGVTRSRVAAIDADSGQATAWNPELDLFYSASLASYVLTLQISGDTIFLGGQFSTVGREQRVDLAAVNATTGQILAWNPNQDGGVSTLAMGGRLALAGFVASPGGKQRRNLAAFDAVTGSPTDWNPDADGEVLALAAAGNTIYAGGSFSKVSSVPRSHLAALDAVSGGSLSGWTNIANADVRALTISGGTLYAGGSFTSINGATRQRLAAFNATNGQLITTWAPLADGAVYTLASSGNTIYAGGNFVTIGQTRRHIAALDATTGQLQPWDPGAADTVLALALSEGTVYAGGSFTSVAGQPRNYLAAIDALSGLASDWNPIADDEVRAIAISGETIYIAGIFQNVAGQTRLGCAAVDISGTLLDWNPGTSVRNQIYSLAPSDNTVYAVGGELQFQGSSTTHWLAAFPRPGAPVINVAPLDQQVLVGQSASFIVQVSGQQPLFYQWRFGGINLVNETNATLMRTSLQLSQSGSYEVLVTNSLGAATASATLTVMQPVSISQQPSSQTGLSASNVVLTVDASGSPPPLYQWRRNGVNIPGQVYSTLTLTNVNPTSSGSYHVAVANRLGAINSDIAEVVINTTRLAFADNFSNRVSITASSGVRQGDNLGATAEPNEPRHAGKLGGASVWARWTAPANGIATFSTLGSGFDTLLAVYTGTNLLSLEAQASDDDRAGYANSRVLFNAVAGTEYSIAIDGLAGAMGNLVLSWQLDTTATDFPRIIADPLSQSVSAGGTASFQVTATSPTPMQFQWYFGCREMPGATNSILVISNAQARDVGSYHVLVMNVSTRVAESLPADLELTFNASGLSFDKLEDALAASANGGKSASGSFRANLTSSAADGSFLVSMGSIVSDTFDTTGYQNGLHETNHCGVIGGASAWLNFKTTQDGVVLVDTIGSLFDTVLAVYFNTNLLVLYYHPNDALVACDNNSAPDGIRSQLRFNATAGTPYFAAVDGVGGAKGIATVHWRLGSAPLIIASGSNITQRVGGTALLNCGVTSAVASATYQWRLNGTDVPGATGPTLTLNNLQPAQAGTYTVVVSNFAGVVTNISANVTVDVPLHFEQFRWMSSRQFSCQVKGNVGQSFAVQVSTDLNQWDTLITDQLSNGSFTFSDTDSPQFTNRFYRVVEP